MKKKNIIISSCLVVFSILFTILVKNVDVSSIGPNGSTVGFSSINKFFHDLIGVNLLFYKLTDILGYVAILLAIGYAIVGLLQLIKRKSILKIDKQIIVTGIFYVIIVCIYVFFEKVIINYRPTLIDDILEASYPSSHTLLSLCICGSTILLNKRFYSKIKIAHYEIILAYVLMVLILFGRIVSGVHWFTDIMGGVIISITLLYIYNSVIKLLSIKK